MNVASHIEIEASAARVWSVFTRVESWPAWTPSVTSVDALDGPEIAIGHRFRIEQPKLPPLVWEVTAVDPPVSWTWSVRSFGATTSARHVVSPLGPRHSAVTQVIEQRGLFGVIAGLLTRRLTRRYLAMEASGLKVVSEQAARATNA
jgi:hypothetical protein